MTIIEKNSWEEKTKEGGCQLVVERVDGSDTVQIIEYHYTLVPHYELINYFKIHVRLAKQDLDKVAEVAARVNRVIKQMKRLPFDPWEKIDGYIMLNSHGGAWDAGMLDKLAHVVLGVWNTVNDPDGKVFDALHESSLRSAAAFKENGTPLVICPNCKGKKRVPYPAGEMEDCWQCGAKGVMPLPSPATGKCSRCHDDGFTHESLVHLCARCIVEFEKGAAPPAEVP